MVKTASLTAGELWEAMRQGGFPCALFDPVKHVILDANEEYASLLGLDFEDIKGHDLISLYGDAVESIDAAFVRGTLRFTSGQTDFRRPDGTVVTIKGWARRIDGIGSGPLVVASAVDAEKNNLLDDKAWVARAPEAFGIPAETSEFAPEASASRVGELELLMGRLGLEVRAAGLVPVIHEKSDGRLLQAYDELSSRQREVIGLLAAGYRVGEIGRKLFLAPSTVRNHLTAVYRKFGINSQVELLTLLTERNNGRGD